mgnify:CR=1 FL=1
MTSASTLAGPHRRKLVDVANDQEGGHVRHGLHERLHQQDIRLIDNQQVTVTPACKPSWTGSPSDIPLVQGVPPES